LKSADATQYEQLEEPGAHWPSGLRHIASLAANNWQMSVPRLSPALPGQTPRDR